MEKKGLDKVLDVILSDTFLYLLLITLLGFALRVISAINLGVNADDMHFAPGAIGFLGSGKLEYWDQSSGLWFLLTDLFFKIFGITQLGSRFSAVLFGTLLIPLMFLVTKELFKNNKTAFIAAILVAVSPFHNTSMMAEMDITAMFFVVFSVYLFIKASNENYNWKILILSGILMGLGIYTKVYPLLFIPSLLIYAVYDNHKHKRIKNKILIKKIFIFLLAIFIFCIPALAHNYLLYSETGLMDHRFTGVFGSKEAIAQYSWVAGNDKKWSFQETFLGRYQNGSYVIPGILTAIKYVFFRDMFIITLGLLGLFFIKRKEKILIFLLISFMLVYMSNMMLLPKHFIFLSIFLTFPAAAILEKFSSKIKLRLRYLILIIILFSLIYAGFNFSGPNPYYTSEIQKMMAFKENKIPADSLIITDSRIYRGQVTWMFNDRHYLEVSYFNQLMSIQNQSSNKVLTDVYYIECSIDDCGWGTIGNQPELNSSMEQFTMSFKNNSKQVAVIKSLDRTNNGVYLPFMKGKEQNYFTVYKTQMYLIPGSMGAADSTHIWWMYPLGYNTNISSIWDEIESSSLLYRLAYMIRTLAIFLAFLAIFSIGYYLIKELSEKPESNKPMPEKIIN